MKFIITANYIDHILVCGDEKNLLSWLRKVRSKDYNNTYDQAEIFCINMDDGTTDLLFNIASVDFKVLKHDLLRVIANNYTKGDYRFYHQVFTYYAPDNIDVIYDDIRDWMMI